MKKSMMFLVFSVFFGNFATESVYAQKLLGTYKDWSAFSVEENGNKVCYIMSIPRKKDGNYFKRGEPYLLVTNISDDQEEVSASSGYKYKQKSQPVLEIRRKKYNMFIDGAKAWTNNAEDDVEIVRYMKKEMYVKIYGTSSFDEESIDTYSLFGFDRAFDMMKKNCKDKK